METRFLEESVMSEEQKQQPKKESFALFGILLGIIAFGVLAMILKFIGLF
jgi:hypothetical protein